MFPLISEYIEAIKSAEDNFNELSYLKPVLDEDGSPKMTSGNFAVIFKMKDERDGKFYAIKCFIREQEGRAEAYRQITEELKDVKSSYFVSIHYYDKELYVDTKQTTETKFPVLLMDWVEGKTLDKYLRENLDDKFALEMLAYRFCQLAQWLIPQPFAHGDLKPDNILVREDGSLVLVDYDGMYVPAMKGQKARELGSPDFRHPHRTEDDFDEHIDDFPLASILLSLKAISINPLLFEEYGNSNRLLLNEIDYRDITKSRLMLNFLFMMSIKEFAQTYSLFITATTHFGLANKICDAVNALNYELTFPQLLLYTKVSKKEWKERVKDERGIGYSKDGMKLISGNGLYESYEIHNGTETICDDAFSGKFYWDGSGWNHVKQIVIPQSVKHIGRNPFAFCSVSIICNSSNFILEDNALYTSDKKLLIGYYGYKNDFVVPKGVKIIGDYAFAGRLVKTVILSSTIETIGNCAFLGCQLLEHIEMSNNIISIGHSAFSGCENLQHLELPIGLISIGSSAFSLCYSIQSITIPSTVLSIGINPFLYDKHLNIHCYANLFEVDNKTLYTKNMKFLISCLSQELSFQIPKEVTHIGQHAFYGCPFRKLYIHDNIKYIGKDAFDGCYYEALPYGYSMEILVSKGRLEWAKKHISNRLYLKEIDD